MGRREKRSANIIDEGSNAILTKAVKNLKAYTSRENSFIWIHNLEWIWNAADNTLSWIDGILTHSIGLTAYNVYKSQASHSELPVAYVSCLECMVSADASIPKRSTLYLIAWVGWGDRGSCLVSFETSTTNTSSRSYTKQWSSIESHQKLSKLA